MGTLALFTVPDGWYAEAGNTAGFDHLVAGEPYVLYASESTLLERPEDVAAEVPFTLADLQGLGAWEVWARPTPDALPTAMPETDFRTAAAGQLRRPAAEFCVTTVHAARGGLAPGTCPRMVRAAADPVA